MAEPVEEEEEERVGDATPDLSREDPAALWESEALPVFALTFPDDDWEGALQRAMVDGGCDDRPYVEADLVFTNPLTGVEERWPRVGVRYRGRSSLQSPNNSGESRWGLKLAFEEYFDDRRFHGSEHLSLLGTEGDYSLLRERVALDWMRLAGVQAPRANHAKIVVNGELLGVFPLIEEADDRAFLDAHFGDDQGHFYKVGGYCHGTDLDYVGDDVDRYDGFEAKGVTTDADKADALIPMLACLEAGDEAAMGACLEQWLDPEEFLSEIAVDMLLGNVDGMAATGQNFLLYRPTDGRFVAYPYDLDLTFYTNEAGLLGTTIFDLRPTWEPRLPVLPRTLREVYAPAFCARVLALAADPGPDALAAHVEAIAAQIDAAIQEDPFISHDKWRDRVEKLVETAHERHARVIDEATDCDIPPLVADPPL